MAKNNNPFTSPMQGRPAEGRPAEGRPAQGRPMGGRPVAGRRAMDELVLAEMFLVQATIESASIVGDGLSELGRRLSAGGETRDGIADLVQRTAGEAIEPYTSRYRVFRQLRNGDD